MDLTGRPVHQKADTGKDPAYLAIVVTLPCCICEAYGLPQTSPTQAHHTICGRYSARRTPDREAIPLCEGHHQGMFDTSKLAIHRGKATWVEAFGSDRDWIEQTQERVDAINWTRGRTFS